MGTLGRYLLHLFGNDLANEFGPLMVISWILIALGILLAGGSIVAAIAHWREGRPSPWKTAGFVLLGSVLTAAGLWLWIRPDLTPEERADAALERLKGAITRNLNAPNKPIIAVSFQNSREMKLRDKRFTIIDDGHLAYLQPHLEALGELRNLNLLNTDITDEGLTHLRGLKQLATLELGNSGVLGHNRSTRFTAEGIDQLRKALPNTKIDVYWPR